MHLLPLYPYRKLIGCGIHEKLRPTGNTSYGKDGRVSRPATVQGHKMLMMKSKQVIGFQVGIVPHVAKRAKNRAVSCVKRCCVPFRAASPAVHADNSPEPCSLEQLCVVSYQAVSAKMRCSSPLSKRRARQVEGCALCADSAKLQQTLYTKVQIYLKTHTFFWLIKTTPAADL